MDRETVNRLWKIVLYVYDVCVEEVLVVVAVVSSVMAFNFFFFWWCNVVQGSRNTSS